MRHNVDPVSLEVVGNYLVSSVREMCTTLRRAAYSTILRESLDCSTALFDPRGQLVAQGDHVPSHQGSLSLAARQVTRSTSTKRDAFRTSKTSSETLERVFETLYGTPISGIRPSSSIASAKRAFR